VTASEPRWRRLDPDDRRHAILESAIAAFGKQSYAAVQMAEVARDAGVARGLLNHYFGTKRDLYLAVVREMMIVPELENVRLPTGDLDARIAASVDWLMLVLGRHGATWLAVGADGVGDDEEIRAILDEADDRAAQRALDAIGFDAKGARHEAAMAAIRAFGGMVKAAAREWLYRKSLNDKQIRVLLTGTLVRIAEMVLADEM
jgi:AcrR family transcriptional regulator